MKQVTLNIPDSKYDFFMELVANLNLSVSEENSYEIPEWQQDEVAERLERLKKGTAKTRPWDEAEKDIFNK